MLSLFVCIEPITAPGSWLIGGDLDGGLARSEWCSLRVARLARNSVFEAGYPSAALGAVEKSDLHIRWSGGYGLGGTVILYYPESSREADFGRRVVLATLL